MPKYNDFDLDVQSHPTTEVNGIALTKYCPSMWCTEPCTTKPPVEM